jgi:hypothetical protein
MSRLLKSWIAEAALDSKKYGIESNTAGCIPGPCTSLLNPHIRV